MKVKLTSAEKDAIKSTVAKAEEKTNGEIVVYLVPRSDNYEAVIWRGSLIGFLTVIGITFVFEVLSNSWGPIWVYSRWGLPLLALLGGAVTAAIVHFVPAVLRLLAGDAILRKAVRRKAMDAFYEEEVFNTKDRTGILLFVSMMEHRIEIVADQGIDILVDTNEWQEVVSIIRNGVRTGQLSNGLVKAVEKCGLLLQIKHGIKEDDRNELSDEIRIGDNE